MKVRYDKVIAEKAASLEEETKTLAFSRFRELCLKLSLTYGVVASKLKVAIPPSPSLLSFSLSLSLSLSLSSPLPSHLVIFVFLTSLM
jgi:hypothetical protein